MKKCPFCAEDIQDAAIKCRYCGSLLDGAESPTANRHPSGDEVSDVRELARQGKKIEAIKLLRDKTGWDLKAAKEFVEATPGLPPSVPTEQSGRRRGLGLAAVVIGFLMTLTSSAAGGFGILLIWFGVAFAAKGGAVARWGGGFILALIFGGIGLSMGGARPVRSSAPSSTPASGVAASADVPARPIPPVASDQLAIVSSRGYETVSSCGRRSFEPLTPTSMNSATTAQPLRSQNSRSSRV